MNSFQKGFIALIKSAITGSSEVLPEEFNWEEAYNLAVRHQILSIMYYGILNSKPAIPEEFLTKFSNGCCAACIINTNQLYEFEKIYNAFDKNSIDYMLLKGVYLKSIYPRPEMRQMSDADILIKPEQYSKIESIMEENGYSHIIESDHEHIWKKNKIITIELHKSLLPSYDKDFYEYFGDGWKFAFKNNDNKYELSREDNFIYLFVHYAKHYRNSGIGLRHITDFYIFLNANPNINIKYIEKRLKNLHLLKFYKNTLATIKVWFENAKTTEITDFITDKIFQSGSYGKFKTVIISTALKKSKYEKNPRANIILNLIFPSYKNMCEKYPSLSGKAVLLPFFWIWRLFKIVFTKRNILKNYRKAIKSMTNKNISEFQKELNYVGLDFNFKE